MKRYYNSDERYGEAGPFEAESREALADEMMPTFREWAAQKADGAGQEGIELNEGELVAQMRREFIAALEEVAKETCSLCGKPTEFEKQEIRAEWYLCPDCEGTPAAEAAGFSHKE